VARRMSTKIMKSILLLCLGVFLASGVRAQSGAPQKVVVIEIATEVDLGMVAYVERSVAEAEKQHADILLHVNTFGGRVDCATKIRDAVLNAKVPMTVAFVDKRAISAGAFITLAAQKIVMASGSTIGAATPIYETGEKASEKVNSYMRAEMRSTAERNHRDPRIAEAMVDESLGLDTSYKIKLDTGKLLTMTEEDAMKVGYCDAKAESVQAALDAVGIKSAEIVSTDESFGDKVIRFLTSGIVSSLLIMIGMAGIFYTIKTGHFGAITIAAAAALILFFSAQYITDVAPILALVLFLAGVVLILLEITPIPTFGLAGVLGIIGIGAGLFLALAGDMRTLTPERMQQTFVTLAIALVGVIVLGFVIVKYGPKATWLRKFRNEAFTADTGFYAEKARIIGQRGTALTMLRPAGIVMLGDVKIDAVTSGAFIEPGTAVEVTMMRGNRAVVAATEEQVHEASPTHDHGDAFGGRIAS
jgi:membrane-bound serine protease (ClpP class)